MTAPEDCPIVNMPMSERRKLHLNRGINIDTILTMLAMAAAFFAWSMNQERRTTIIEGAIKAQTDINTKQDDEVKAMNARMEAWMIRVEGKVDRVLGGKGRS